MKKKLFGIMYGIACSALFFCGCGSSAVSDNNVQGGYDTQGDSGQDSSLENDGYVQEKKITEKHVYMYDSNGEGRLVSEIRWFYDSYGRKIKEIETDLVDNRETMHQYEWGSNGRISRETIYTNGIAEIVADLEYDEMERQTDYNQFDGSGNITFYTVVEPTLSVNILRHKGYLSDNSLNSITDVTYDNDGNIIERKLYNSEGELNQYEERQNHENGYQKDVKLYWVEDDTIQYQDYTHYKYNQDQICISSIEYDYFDGSEFREWNIGEYSVHSGTFCETKYEYDSDGDVVVEEYYTNDGSSYTTPAGDELGENMLYLRVEWKYEEMSVSKMN